MTDNKEGWRYCKHNQHIFNLKKTNKTCMLLGHKLDWHNHLVHEDIIAIPKGKAIYDKDGKQVGYGCPGYVLGANGQPVTNELLQMCLRCKLYFDGKADRRLFGIVSIESVKPLLEKVE